MRVWLSAGELLGEKSCDNSLFEFIGWGVLFSSTLWIRVSAELNFWLLSSIDVTSSIWHLPLLLLVNKVYLSLRVSQVPNLTSGNVKTFGFKLNWLVVFCFAGLSSSFFHLNVLFIVGFGFDSARTFALYLALHFCHYPA